jgi:hypothetical protein
MFGFYSCLFTCVKKVLQSFVLKRSDHNSFCNPCGYISQYLFSMECRAGARRPRTRRPRWR